MNYTRITFIPVAVALVLIGCEPTVSTIDEPDPRSPKASEQLLDDNYSHIVVSKNHQEPGEGTIAGKAVLDLGVSDFFPPLIEEFRFWAESKDGEVRGRFDVWDYDPEGNLIVEGHGIVTCLVFEEDGRTVRLAGETTSGSGRGGGALWTVIDNGVEDGNQGQRDGGTADATSGLFFGTSQGGRDFHCAVGIPKDNLTFVSGCEDTVSGLCALQRGDIKKDHGHGAGWGPVQ